MKKLLLSTMVAFTMIFCMQSTVAANNYGRITVEGYAQETYKVTQSVVMVTNSTEEETLEKAKTKNDRMSAAFRESLRALGVEDKDVLTVSYQIKPKRYRIKDTDSYRVMQSVSNILQVTINDLNKTSRVIDAAAAAGITDVRLSKMDLNDTEKAEQRQALIVKAAKDARQKANAIAEALGTRIIGVEAMDVGYGFGRHSNKRYLAKEAQAESTASAIEYGEDSEEMRVTVTFKIK